MSGYVLTVIIVLFLLYVLAGVLDFFGQIERKDYFQIARHIYVRRLSFLIKSVFEGIYTEQITVDKFRTYSKDMGIDPYQLHTFCMNNNIEDLKTISKLFIRYRDSYYDIDRVKVMNTYNFHKQVVENIELCNKLRDIVEDNNQRNLVFSSAAKGEVCEQ